MPAQKTNPIYYVLIQQEGTSAQDRVDVTDSVLSLEYEDSEKKADLLKLTVDNWDLSFFDDPLWRPGVSVFVSWGYPGMMSPTRQCIIQKVSGSTTLSIEAQSKAVLMNKVVNTKTYTNTTRAAVVKTIAKSYGYTDSTMFIDDTIETFEHILQSRQTDAQFLKVLADKEHYEFYIDFDGFHWHERRLGQKPHRVFQYYLPPDVGDILSFNLENDIFAKPGQVTTKGRDPVSKKDVGGDAKDSETQRESLNPIVEIPDPATGESTFTVQAASSDLKATSSTNPDQAKKEADGAYKRAILTTAKLSLELVGDPGVLGKTIVQINGISKRLSGLYYVNQINHKLDSGGYKMTMKCQTDGTQTKPTAAAKPPSKATPNTQTAGDPNELGLKEVISGETGETSGYEYGSTPGRDNAKK